MIGWDRIECDKADDGLPNGRKYNEGRGGWIIYCEVEFRDLWKMGERDRRKFEDGVKEAVNVADDRQ